MTLVKGRALEELFALAYANAPKKSAFIANVGNLPGVLCSHESNAFVSGFAKCFQMFSDEQLHMVEFISTATEHSFLLQDIQHFQMALEDVKNRTHAQVPTTRKVMVKMVHQRMMSLLKAVHGRNELCAQYPNSYKNTSVVPTLCSKQSFVDWVEHNKNQNYNDKVIINADIISILTRDDILDDVYLEAWDLVQVREIMES